MAHKSEKRHIKIKNGTYPFFLGENPENELWKL
jgi:hypothetical protein